MKDESATRPTAVIPAAAQRNAGIQVIKHNLDSVVAAGWRRNGMTAADNVVNPL